MIVRNSLSESFIDRNHVLSFSAVARVVTDLESKNIEIVGIDPGTKSITLVTRSHSQSILIEPNKVYRLSKDGEFTLSQAIEFSYTKQIGQEK